MFPRLWVLWEVCVTDRQDTPRHTPGEWGWRRQCECPKCHERESGLQDLMESARRFVSYYESRAHLLGNGRASLSLHEFRAAIEKAEGSQP